MSSAPMASRAARFGASAESRILMSSHRYECSSRDFGARTALSGWRLSCSCPSTILKNGFTPTRGGHPPQQTFEHRIAEAHQNQIGLVGKAALPKHQKGLIQPIIRDRQVIDFCIVAPSSVSRRFDARIGSSTPFRR